MNRLKVWVFALLAALVSVALLRAHSDGLRRDAIARLDARLTAGAVHARSSLAAIERSTAALAALVARDPELARALAPALPPPEAPAGRRARGAPPPAPPAKQDGGAQDAASERAARAALASAARALGLPGLPDGTLVAAGDRAALERRVAAGPLGPAALRVKVALEGSPPPGLIRAGNTLFAAASATAPAGAAVAVLVPVADAFAHEVAIATQLDVALTAPEARLVSTGRSAEAPALVEAARKGAGEPVALGALGPVDVTAPPLALRGLPPLFRAPAQRALAVPLPGLEGGLLVLSAATAPVLAPVAVFEWRALAVALLLFVLGLLFGLLVRPTEVLPSVPEELLAAAVRIEHGDFEARAPRLAGKLGTLAEALNRAASAAAAAPEKSAPREEPFGAPAPPPSVEPSAFEFPARPPRAEPLPASGDGAPFGGGAFAAAPVAARDEPLPAAPAVAASSPAPAASFAAAAAASAAAPAAERSAPADPGADEEGHWRETFEDFLRVRAECGEPAQGLPYERFRQKLQANKATLVAKYGCRTVRFQVYVKEGKPALKATPVR